MTTLINRLQFSNARDRNNTKDYIRTLNNIYGNNENKSLDLKIGLLFTRYQDRKYSNYLNRVGLLIGFLGFKNTKKESEKPITVWLTMKHQL